MNRKKKKIFFHLGALSPIIETELELIKNAKKNDDLVTVVQCVGNIRSCYWNIDNFKPYCNVCSSKFNNGIKFLELDNKIEKIELNPDKKKEIKIKFKNINSVKKFTYDNSPLGYGVSSSLQTLIKDYKPNLKDHEKLFKDILHSSISIYDFVKKLLIKKKPSEIYIFNGRIAESWPIVCLARKLNIDFYTYEVANSSKDKYQIYKNSTIHMANNDLKIPKNYFNKNLKKKIKVASNFIKKKQNLFETSTLKNYTENFKKNLLPKDLNLKLRNITIFNSSIEELNSIKNFSLNIYKSHNNAIFKIFHHFKNDKRFFFYLRLHPGLGKKDIDSSQLKEIIYECKKYSNVKVIWPEEKIDSYSLLNISEKIITFGSTIGFESSFIGKPVISIDNKFFKNLNYAYFPKSHQQTIKLIKTKKLKPKNKLNSVYFFNHLLDRGFKFKNFKTKNNKFFFKNKVIKSDKSIVINYYFLKFIYKIKKFEFKTIVNFVKNLSIIKRIFYYY